MSSGKISIMPGVTKIKVGILGVGMVGGALARYFLEKKKLKRGRDIFLCDADPMKDYHDDVNAADVIFVAVPTPRNPKNGACETSIVEDALRVIASGKTVVIKSTVPPGTTADLQERFPELTMLFNPEFLTEKNAWNDMLKPPRQIVGYVHKKGIGEAMKVLALLPKAPLVSPGVSGGKTQRITATEAEFIKYASNVYLSRRVAFANALAMAAEHMDADYDVIRAALVTDGRIGNSHWNVDYDGYRGFGGFCFPKDTAAFIAFARREGLSEVEALIRADWDFNERLLASQGLSVDEVSGHSFKTKLLRKRK